MPNDDPPTIADDVPPLQSQRGAESPLPEELRGAGNPSLEEQRGTDNPLREEQDDNENPDFFALSVLLTWMGAFLLVAILALIFLVTTVDGFFAMLLWSFGLCAAGAIVGFLFGIPRVVPQAPQLQPNGNITTAGGVTVAASKAVARRLRLAANTNLEQVSDWLTKIIVGVGLVELNKIPGLTNKLAVVISDSYGGNNDQGMSIATGIIVLFSTGGFLIGYVTTRAFLPFIFEPNSTPPGSGPSA